MNISHTVSLNPCDHIITTAMVFSTFQMSNIEAQRSALAIQPEWWSWGSKPGLSVRPGLLTFTWQWV